ncbi:MAG: DUF3419 family protein [Candidatus Uhrbacteria bacterium]
MPVDQKLRAWFFTNEILAGFLSRLPERGRVKRAFGVAGGGDWAFNFLSEANNLDQLILCDQRLSSCLTVRLKKILFNELSLVEAQAFLLNKNILRVFKKSRVWYKDSFLSASQLAEYTPYLVQPEKFSTLRSNLKKIQVQPGDFLSLLKNFPDNYFDLIYTSNIFDSPSYFQPSSEELQIIKQKLTSGGRLLVVAQDTQKELIKKLSLAGFKLTASEFHHFNLWRAFWRYDYSFLLLEKT